MKQPDNLDIDAYAKELLTKLHGPETKWPGEIEIRYVTKPYTWEGKIKYTVQYYYITEWPNMGKCGAKCSYEIEFDE